MTTTTLLLNLIIALIIPQQIGDISIDAPFVHQIDDLPKDLKPIIRSTACGPAVLAMVLNHQGNNFTLEEIISKLPSSVYVKGDRYYNLMAGPNYFGYTSNKIEKSPKSLFKILNKGFPIILNVQNYDGITGHALVVIGMKGFDGEHAESLIVHDPYRNASREFKYINDNQLQQPEGYINYIGHNAPFYITKQQLVSR